MADALEKPVVVIAEKTAPQIPAPIADNEVVMIEEKAG
jgi:hypothetical protein